MISANLDPSEWVDRYGDYLFRYAMLRLRDRSAAEDLVQETFSESMDHSLPLGKRIGVRVHILMCKFCARYERQLLLIRETVRRLVATEEKPEEPTGEILSKEAKARIRKSLTKP